MFRYLNDLLGEASIDVGAFARARLEQARQAAVEAGYVLYIPALAEPMGTWPGGHVGFSRFIAHSAPQAV
jgi:hypothetical protein